jgi:hypothetical protein
MIGLVIWILSTAYTPSAKFDHINGAFFTGNKVATRQKNDLPW